MFVTALKFLLRAFSYLFHLGLSVFLAGIGAVGWLSGSDSFQLAMVPWWSGKALIRMLVLGGAAGIMVTVMAMRGRFKLLFALWTTGVLAAVVSGFFFSHFTFEGASGFQEALCFTAAAGAAWLGGMQQMFRKR